MPLRHEFSPDCVCTPILVVSAPNFPGDDEEFGVWAGWGKIARFSD